jgi:hypothetical protein
MTQMRDVIREWKLLLNQKQDLSPIRFALSGDGSSATTADILNRPGWAWVRYDEEQNKVSQVRNRKIPGVPQDVPLIIGKEFPTDRYVQILGINWPLYDMFVTNPQLIQYLTPPHGDSHHAVYGNDPAYIDVRNILNGRVRATAPTTMGVYVEAMAYEYQDERSVFAGEGVDLAGHIPTTADTHGYVAVSFDVIEQGLRTVAGLTNPVAAPATLPDIPIWNIPLCAVLMYNGMTEIIETDIYDLRILFEPIGKYNTYRNFVQYMAYNDEVWTRHLTGDF